MNYNHFPFLSEKCADSPKCVRTSARHARADEPEQRTGSGKWQQRLRGRLVDFQTLPRSPFDDPHMLPILSVLQTALLMGLQQKVSAFPPTCERASGWRGAELVTGGGFEQHTVHLGSCSGGDGSGAFRTSPFKRTGGQQTGRCAACWLPILKACFSLKCLSDTKCSRNCRQDELKVEIIFFFVIWVK